MFSEKNTDTNLPAQIELYATTGNEYNFMFIAKGGGSANKTFLYQQTKALLNPEKLLKFVDEKVKVFGFVYHNKGNKSIVAKHLAFIFTFWKEGHSVKGQPPALPTEQVWWTGSGGRLPGEQI